MQIKSKNEQIISLHKKLICQGLEVQLNGRASSYHVPVSVFDPQLNQTKIFTLTKESLNTFIYMLF